MTPTWIVVLVGLGAGVLGTLLTTLLTISHERAAELRSRMLDAADQFSTGTINALQTARNAAGQIKKDAVPLIDEDTNWYRPEIEAVLDRASDTVDDLLAKQARVHLLFGDNSDAGIAAAGVASHLRNVMMELEHQPDSIRGYESYSAYSRNFNGAREQHEKFNRAARATITKRWWSLPGSLMRRAGAAAKRASADPVRAASRARGLLRRARGRDSAGD